MKPPKVFSIRGKKQVGFIKSNEKGILVSTVFCASASGNYIPPALIFPRQKINFQLKKGLPPDAVCFSSKNGWINSNIFLEWLKFFQSHVRPTPAKKALLILDNHEAHRSIEAIEYAKENNIVILSLPPHTSHRVQPLDVGVFSSFKGRFEKIVSRWQKENPGRVITLYEMGELFTPAYLFAASPSNAINGFKQTGIPTCNIDIFNERDFMPASVTGDNDVSPPLVSSNPLPTVPVLSTPTTNSTQTTTIDKGLPESENEDDPGYPEDSPLAEKLPSIPMTHRPEDIRPIPKSVLIMNTQRNNRSQKSEILTSTPVKNRIKLQLEDRQNKKKAAEDKVKLRKTKGKRIEKQKLTKGKKTEKQKLIFPKPPKEPEREDDVPCLICSSMVSTSREVWLQCNICCNWAHQACTDYSGVGFYMCDFCKSSFY
jgi:hypothetical protein